MKEIINELKLIADGKLTPDESLCSYFEIEFDKELLEGDHHFLIPNEIVRDWEHWSGSFVFPIPDPNYPGDRRMAFNIFNSVRGRGLYEGEYGRLRREFARYCATYLEQQLEITR